MMTETERLDDYIAAHCDPEPDYLYRLYRATNIHTIHGRMASGHVQGRLLKMLVTMVRPKNILEVGTFSGYSALCMAEGLVQGIGYLLRKLRKACLPLLISCQMAAELAAFVKFARLGILAADGLFHMLCQKFPRALFQLQLLG